MTTEVPAHFSANWFAVFREVNALLLARIDDGTIGETQAAAAGVASGARFAVWGALTRDEFVGICEEAFDAATEDMQT